MKNTPESEIVEIAWSFFFTVDSDADTPNHKIIDHIKIMPK